VTYNFITKEMMLTVIMQGN